MIQLYRFVPGAGCEHAKVAHPNGVLAEYFFTLERNRNLAIVERRVIRTYKKAQEQGTGATVR